MPHRHVRAPVRGAPRVLPLVSGGAIWFGTDAGTIGRADARSGGR